MLNQCPTFGKTTELTRFGKGFRNLAMLPPPESSAHPSHRLYKSTVGLMVIRDGLVDHSGQDQHIYNDLAAGKT